MTIKVNKKISKRIKTIQDLNDFFAYCERNYDNDYYDQEEYVDNLPTYEFPENEQNRIFGLIDGINYCSGHYNEQNIKRILGKAYND